MHGITILSLFNLITISTFPLYSNSSSFNSSDDKFIESYNSKEVSSDIISSNYNFFDPFNCIIPNSSINEFSTNPYTFVSDINIKDDIPILLSFDKTLLTPTEKVLFNCSEDFISIFDNLILTYSIKFTNSSLYNFELESFTYYSTDFQCFVYDFSSKFYDNELFFEHYLDSSIVETICLFISSPFISKFSTKIAFTDLPYFSPNLVSMNRFHQVINDVNYDLGFNRGHDDAIEEDFIKTYQPLTFFRTITDFMVDILNIEIVPNFKLSYIFTVPLMFLVVSTFLGMFTGFAIHTVNRSSTPSRVKKSKKD